MPTLDDFDRPTDRFPGADEPNDRLGSGDTQPAARKRRPGNPAFSFARGCGCMLVILGAVIGAVVFGIRQLPPVAVMGLSWIVEAAIDGSLTVNGEQAAIPEEWHEPVRATLDAYEASYEDGFVSVEHLLGSYLGVFDAVNPGTEQEARIRAFVLHLREGVLPDVRATLPPLPEPPEQAAAIQEVVAEPWDGFAFLSPEERVAQHQKRQRLAHVLSRIYGPTSRAKVLPPGAVILDFQPPEFPYNEIRNDWNFTTPVEGGMLFREGASGFSDDASLAIVILPGAHDAEGALEFVTTSGSLSFWYYFDGRAQPGGALTVAVDGQERFRDELPTVMPGRLATAWRPVELRDLNAHVPARVSVRVVASGAEQECIIYIDDLVFGP